MQEYQRLQKSDRHSLLQIRQGLWQILFHQPAPTNCWLLGESDGLTLIDAGRVWCGPLILDSVAAIGHPLKRSIITHAHPDHAGAAAELAKKTGAVVVAHEKDTEFLDGTRSISQVRGYWLCRAVLGAAKLIGALDTPPVERIQQVKDGENIARLKVIHTPGHTPGSISLWDAQEKSLFCGDNLHFRMGALRIGFPFFTLDSATQKSSLRRYLDLDANTLLAGHGNVFEGDLAKTVRGLL
jgi:glyoxylase-like metal-dependent hydrolase (beta-lactamase superfamily II)